MAQDCYNNACSEETMVNYFERIVGESVIHFSLQELNSTGIEGMNGDSIAAMALKRYYKKFFVEKDYSDCEFNDGCLDNIYFEIADINHDGVPKLIIYDDTNMYSYTVYTYYEGKVIPLKIAGHDGDIIYFDKGNIVIGTEFVMGYTFVNWYRIENGQKEKLASYSNNEGEVGLELMDEVFKVNERETDQKTLMAFIHKNNLEENHVVKDYTMYKFGEDAFINRADSYKSK